MENIEARVKPNFFGLVPFFVFIIIYLGTGIYLGTLGVEMAFYQLPASVAMFFASIVCFLIFKGKFSDKIHIFIKGASQYDIILMCLIFMLSGAFSSLCGEIGCVEAVANLGIKYINSNWLVSGIFFITCFLSFSAGTSVGSIVAIAPIAFNIAFKSNINPNLIAASVMCGAMFGDNLSLISDTTIVSSRTQGSNILDVFISSSFYAFPSAILTFFSFFFLSENLINTPSNFLDEGSIDLVKTVPYLIIIFFSLAGMNVFLVLFWGIFSVCFISVLYGNLYFLDIMKNINKGFLNMADLIFLSILTGGVSFTAIHSGGIKWLLVKLRSFIRGKSSAEFSIGALVSMVDIFLANNTIAILICGKVAKKIAFENNISLQRSASILDMFSCIFQGILPYGAQMIILVGFSNGLVSPISVLPFLVYFGFLLFFVILSILGIDIRKLFLYFFKK
ncbi:Na+/H+ antiporter NhaC family protein [Borreliella sinica]|uniref:Na+/H+ antiporter NhaC family protein n=1 Tax=Borreliella sinica TaxID=87162 RepID=UPI002A242814|nr:Na+/H+ antiporter NhaC family protein [Borreliella sinica]WPM05700.1 Na+/H+ antiporter NhaC family protein [Borreliella sinica]